MARFRIVRWNADAIQRQKPTRILQEYGKLIAPQLQESVRTVRYDWPNPTVRFTSLFMGGAPVKGAGPFSPPTTAAGARNTNKFKSRIQSNKSTGSGVLVDSPRDIVDTGTLYNSQQPPRVSAEAGRISMRIVWNAPYSGVVLRGGDYGSYINVFGRLVRVGTKPGRDWISPVLAQSPPRRFFIEAWRSQAGPTAQNA